MNNTTLFNKKKSSKFLHESLKKEQARKRCKCKGELKGRAN